MASDTFSNFMALANGKPVLDPRTTMAIVARAKARADAMSEDALAQRAEYLKAIEDMTPDYSAAIAPYEQVYGAPKQVQPATIGALANPQGLPAGAGAIVNGMQNSNVIAYQSPAAGINMDALSLAQKQTQPWQIKVTNDGLIAMDLNAFKAYSSALSMVGQQAARTAALGAPNLSAFVK
jgi:hypothetical protein